MRSRFLWFLSIPLVAMIVSCDNKEGNTSKKKDFLADNLDTTVSPSQDFFQYANGGWIKRNPIPGDQAGWGIGNLVIEENLKRFKELNEKAATSHARWARMRPTPPTSTRSEASTSSSFSRSSRTLSTRSGNGC